MSSTTTNYSLHKIDLTDAPPDITVLNPNWDTIDTELKKKYDPDNKPTLADLGAAPSGYGLGSAQQFAAENIDSTTKPGFYFNNESMTIGGVTSTRWWMHVSAYGTGSTFATQRIFASYNYGYELIRRKINGTWTSWEHVTSPMMEGREYLSTEVYNNQCIFKRAVGGTIQYRIDGTSTWYPYTGNKPTGSYTGNGSGTSRTIDTGVMSNAIILWGDGIYGYMSLVTPQGIICKDTATVEGGNSGVATFRDGVLTIASSNEIYNENGRTYHYQVL